MITSNKKLKNDWVGHSLKSASLKKLSLKVSVERHRIFSQRNSNGVLKIGA